MPLASLEYRRNFLDYFLELVQDMEECDDVELRGALRLGKEKIRIPTPAFPLQLTLGGEDGQRFNLAPEMHFEASGGLAFGGDYLLFEPDAYFSRISGFIRLSPGMSLTLGRESEFQRQVLSYTADAVELRHLRLKLTPKGLAFKKKTSVRDACVAPLLDKATIERQLAWRRAKFEQLATILDAPIAHPSSRSEALALLEHVVQIMEREPYRTVTREGGPGGLLRLPEAPIPIFVGDLHARIDNLLVVLTQNAFLESIQSGSAMLIILGDAVHPDEPGMEDDMDMSMLMMDLILRLKARFPDRVFYLRGNHDSFSEEISKGGVPQGLAWERDLHDRRGRKYRNAMQALYDRLPYVAMSPDFLVTHAGAPSIKCSSDELIHIGEHPRLAYQLTHVRPRRPNGASGYTRGDVARLRSRLGLEGHTPFIVGHTPLTPDETCWSDAAGIENHHVIFGADPHRIGVITRVAGQLLPLRYSVEPLMTLYNRLVETGKLEA